jgi:pectinesterase
MHYFKACAIKGTIDFIFRSAESFYEECKIVLVLKQAVALPMAPPEQDRSRNTIKIARGKSGLAFKTGTIEGEGEKIYLGRVGKPVIYSYTNIGKEIIGIISNGQDVQTARGTTPTSITSSPLFVYDCEIKGVVDYVY